MIDFVYWGDNEIETFAIGDFEYFFNDNGVGIYRLVNSYSDELLIPSYIEYKNTKYDVTEIGNYAFRGENITSVTIPDSILIIGKGAFYNSALCSVEFGSGLTRIEDKAFYNCEGLVSFDFTNSVNLEYIGDYAFKSCIYYNEELIRIEFPEKLETIGEGAFENCGNYVEYYIPGSVTTIGKEAFSSSTGWNTNIVFASAAEKLDNWADNCFGNATMALYNMTRNSKTQTYENINYVVNANNEAYVVSVKSGLGTETLTIPEKIGEYNVTRIVRDAFFYCGYKKIIIEAKISEIEPYTFYGSVEEVVLPETCTKICESAFTYSLIKTIDLTYVKEIEAYAFNQCSQLENVYIPSTVTTIGYNAFYDCLNITINVESEEKPSGWNDNWCDVNLIDFVHWGVEK